MTLHASKIDGFTMKASDGSIDWPLRPIHHGISRKQLEGSPAHDRSQAVDRACEYAFHDYCDDKRGVELT